MVRTLIESGTAANARKEITDNLNTHTKALSRKQQSGSVVDTVKLQYKLAVAEMNLELLTNDSQAQTQARMSKRMRLASGRAKRVCPKSFTGNKQVVASLHFLESWRDWNDFMAFNCTDLLFILVNVDKSLRSGSVVTENAISVISTTSVPDNAKIVINATSVTEDGKSVNYMTKMTENAQNENATAKLTENAQSVNCMAKVTEKTTYTITARDSIVMQAAKRVIEGTFGSMQDILHESDTQLLDWTSIFTNIFNGYTKCQMRVLETADLADCNLSELVGLAIKNLCDILVSVCDRVALFLETDGKRRDLRGIDGCIVLVVQSVKHLISVCRVEADVVFSALLTSFLSHWACTRGKEHPMRSHLVNSSMQECIFESIGYLPRSLSQRSKDLIYQLAVKTDDMSSISRKSVDFLLEMALHRTGESLLIRI